MGRANVPERIAWTTTENPESVLKAERRIDDPPF
jgi:hypothetical protein